MMRAINTVAFGKFSRRNKRLDGSPVSVKVMTPIRRAEVGGVENEYINERKLNHPFPCRSKLWVTVSDLDDLH